MTEFVEFITSSRFIISCIVAVAALALWAGAKRMIARFENSDPRRRNMLSSMRTALRILIFLIAALTILQVNNVNVTSLVASLGLVSAVIGLALQDYLKDIIMSLHFRSDDFFSVGDVVRFGDVEGVVTSFTIKSVKIENICDHSTTTICNRDITQITVLSDIMDIDVPLSYEDPAGKVRPVLSGICSQILSDKNVSSCTLLGTYAFNASDISYRIRIKCPPAARLSVRIAAMTAIQNGLHEAGIEIPYQQIDIHQK